MLKPVKLFCSAALSCHHREMTSQHEKRRNAHSDSKFYVRTHHEAVLVEEIDYKAVSG